MNGLAGCYVSTIGEPHEYFDVTGYGTVEQPVENGRHQDLVVEDLAPVEEALVAGDDEASAFVTADEKPEEETGFLAIEGEVAKLVEDEQLRVDELLKNPLEPVFPMSCAPQKINPALIARYRLGVIDCFTPVDPTTPPMGASAVKCWRPPRNPFACWSLSLISRGAVLPSMLAGLTTRCLTFRDLFVCTPTQAGRSDLLS